MRYWLNRTLCDVLEEMRKCNETRNFSPILGLIEEAQIMGNKMEAGLSDQKDLFRIRDELSELKDKLNELKKERSKLKPSEDEYE